MSQPTGQELLAERGSAKNVLTQLFRAILGLSLSYLVARVVTDTLVDPAATDTAHHLAVEVGVFVVLALVTLVFSNALPIVRSTRRIVPVVEEQEQRRRQYQNTQAFQSDVQNAFDMAETEDELFDVASEALDIANAGPAEILVADSSRAHIEEATRSRHHDAPGCSVANPGACPAVRRGQTLLFAEPNGLASCPRLRERSLPDGVRALCVPITVLGSPTAVLHSTKEADSDARDLTDAKRRLEATAVIFGARLGMLRAMEQSQLQADTDPLTGLLNRRATENRVRQLRDEATPFAVAMADLDHFKQLNDTYGHDTGDRALRLFARAMTTTFREADIVSRHGGEEFVVVLPGADVVTAAPVLHRLRAVLADALASAELPPFTVSLGLADSTTSRDFHEIVDAADRALLRAKAEGRDRLVVGDSATIEAESAVSPVRR